MVQEMHKPQPRKYQTRAEQQAAYRKRRAISERALLAQKGLPPLPAIPTIPGAARWRAMIEQAHVLLSEAADEMQCYHDDRSEAWQEGDKAEEMLTRLEYLQDTAAQLQDIA
jgi:hypothetical protein